jgi:hypothetical protein
MQKEMGDHGKSDIGRQFPVHIAVLLSLYRQSRDSRNLCVACRRIVCAHYLPEYQFSIAHQAWKQASASEGRQAGGQDAVAIMGEQSVPTPDQMTRRQPFIKAQRFDIDIFSRSSQSAPYDILPAGKVSLATKIQSTIRRGFPLVSSCA